MPGITLVMAMLAEAKPIIDALQLQPVNLETASRLPFLYYQANRSKNDLNLVIAGFDPKTGVENVGTIPAALLTYLGIEAFSPDIIMNCGTAGGVEKLGGRIGDVYLSSGQFLFHDRRIPIAGYDNYGRGGYPSWDTTSLANALGLKQGIVTTGDSLDMSETDRKLIVESGAAMKDMEGAAIAWVCQTLGVPMFAIKAITDLIDHPTETATQFHTNFALACRNLGTEVLRVLEWFDRYGWNL